MRQIVALVMLGLLTGAIVYTIDKHGPREDKD